MLENNIFGLRPYQQDAVCQIEDKWANGERAVLYQLPTAGGKSRIIRTIVDNHCSAKDVIYVIAHRSTLVGQLSKELDEADIKHGIIQAGFPYVRYRTQVCSMQTLIRRLDKLPEASIIIVDESHHIANNSYTKIMEKWPNANILGVTATPSRPDGRGLDKIFTSLILGPTMKELIANGFLSDYEYFAPEKSASMDGVHLKMGDYVQAEALEVVDKKFITGDAIEHYRKYADHKPAICSCISIEHSEHVAASFRAAGYKALSVNSHMKKLEVSAAIEGLRNGTVEILTQCEMLGEGVDVPAATVLIGLRPTNSLVIYLQHCLDEKTEILTSNGWKKKNEVFIGESLPALDLLDNKIKTTRVLNKIDRKLMPQESMYSITSPHLDIRVSNNHNMLVKSKNMKGEDPWIKETAEKMSTRKSFYKIPVSGYQEKYKGSGLSDSELVFLGWFLSDGTYNKINNSIVIYQSSSKRHEWLCDNIRKTLTNCCFKFTEYKTKRTGKWGKYSDGIIFYVSHSVCQSDKEKGLRGWGSLKEWIDKSMGRIYNSLNARELRLLIKGLYYGDGSKNAKITWVSHTMTIAMGNNIVMCDRLQELCELRGLRANYYSYKNKRNGVEWRTLYIKDVQTGSIAGYNVENGSILGKPYKRSRFKKEIATQKENIWCVTNELGTLITRRNGKVAIVGNCGRVLRKSEGKDRAIILDHVGNWERFGLPDDDREWTLAGKKRKKNEKSEIKRCPNCLRVLPITTRVCPYCQYQFVEVAEKGTRTIEEKAGQLVSIRGADPENIQALVRGISRETHNMKQAIKFASNMGFDHRAAWVAVTKYLKMSVDSVW